MIDDPDRQLWKLAELVLDLVVDVEMIEENRNMICDHVA
jgi:hypothetical protein